MSKGSIRHNWKEIESGTQAITDGKVVWEESRHKPLGVEMKRQDRSRPEEGNEAGDVIEAERLRPDTDESEAWGRLDLVSFLTTLSDLSD